MFQHREQGRHDPRVELGAGAAAELVRRLLPRERGRVRAVGGHRGVGVGGGDDASLERDRRRRPGGRGTRCRRSARGGGGPRRPPRAAARRRDTIASPAIGCVRMISHSASSSGPGLARIALGDRDLADVVQPAAEPAAQHERVRQAEPRGDAGGEVATRSAAWASSAPPDTSASARATPTASGSACGASAVARSGEQRDAVAAGALGGVEAAVGRLDERVERVELAARPGRADRDRQPHAHARRRRPAYSATAARSCCARRSSSSSEVTPRSSTANSSPPQRARQSPRPELGLQPRAPARRARRRRRRGRGRR